MTSEEASEVMMPFGIAVYPDAKPLKIDPLPHIDQTRTMRQSVENGAHYITTSRVYVQPNETQSVQRRRTAVSSVRAGQIAEYLAQYRLHWSRAALARRLGVTVRQLHLAELGSVQPDVVDVIQSGLRATPITPDSDRHRARRSRNRTIIDNG